LFIEHFINSFNEYTNLLSYPPPLPSSYPPLTPPLSYYPPAILPITLLLSSHHPLFALSSYHGGYFVSMLRLTCTVLYKVQWLFIFCSYVNIRTCFMMLNFAVQNSNFAVFLNLGRLILTSALSFYHTPLLPLPSSPTTFPTTPHHPHHTLKLSKIS